MSWCAFDARLWVGAFAVLVVAGAWAMLGLFLSQEREREIQEAQAVTTRLSRAFGEHVTRTINGADQAVLTLRAEFQRKGARIDIPALQRSGILASPLYALVSIVGPDGYMLAASTPFKPTYMGDRDYVRMHASTNSDELHIGKPVVGRVTGRRSITLTRRINAPDGSYAGVAIVGLDPDYFAGFYESFDIGSHGAIMLVGRDGVVRSGRWDSPRAPSLGEDLSGAPLFKHLASDAGNYLDTGESDGIARVVGFSRLAEYPLIVAVAMTEEHALAGLRARSPKYYFSAAAFTALVLAFSALLLRAFSRQTEIAQALREREARRAEAEQSLRASEARFRTLFEKAPMAIGVVASKGTIIDANPAYLKLFGFASVDEARGIDAIELYDPSHREEVAAFHASWRNGDTVECRWERIRMRRDGTRFYAEAQVLPMQFPDDVVRVGFVSDITERKRMHEELQHAKDRLELALRGAQLAIFDLDFATGMVTLGEQWAEMMEGVAEERRYPLRAMEDGVHPEDKTRVRCEFVDLIKGRRRYYAARHRVRHPDGSWRWVAWRATVVERDAAGRALRVAGTVADVSEAKRVEDALRETETKLSLVTANVPGVVFQMTYHAGRFSFQYVSQGSAALLGLKPEALCADPGLFLQAIRKRDRKGLEASLVAAAESFQIWAWEGRAGGPNGELRWIQVRATPERMPDGSLRLDGIAIDVTKIKENEQALTETKRLLRELSAHHEAIREQERTRIARELHDELGQLLTGLKLTLSAMTEHEGLDVQEFSAENARVMHLVEQAIAVTRGAVMDLRPPVLDHGLGAAVTWLADQFTQRTGIACSVDLPEQEIELDESRATALFRILQESLTNVAKHAGAGCVHIKLSMSGGCLQLQVTDDGKGFREKEVAAMRSFGLLGMRERAAMLGGHIDIASAPEAGTTVQVEITQLRPAAIAAGRRRPIVRWASQ